jgi:hypothetical protein
MGKWFQVRGALAHARLLEIAENKAVTMSLFDINMKVYFILCLFA